MLTLAKIPDVEIDLKHHRLDRHYSGGFNGAIRLFADDQAVHRYAGSSRDVDSALTVLVVGLIFIALAAIIGRLDELLTPFENGDD